MSWEVKDRIGFFTPVRYGCGAPSWETGLAKVDGCFCWGDKVAEVVQNFSDGKRRIKLKDEPQEVRLKVVAFVGWGLSVVVAGKALIEGQPLGRLQKMAGLVGVGGVGLLLAKGLFRRWLQFGEGHYVYAAHSVDQIELPVKKTLDEMLGGPGTVDALPVFEEGKRPLSVDEMSADMMKGFDQVPYIAIKLRSLGSHIKAVLLLFPRQVSAPCMWYQYYGLVRGPQFFNQLSFTDCNGKLVDNCKEAAGRLARILTEGKGPDALNQPWLYGKEKVESKTV